MINVYRYNKDILSVIITLGGNGSSGKTVFLMELQ